MHMRNIALTGLVLVILTTVGCGKKTEEHANETEMAPAPASQDMTPMPMQDQGMNSEDSQPANADTHAMGTPENDQEESKDGHESSGME